MSAAGSRRALAEIRFGEDRAGVAKVGGRSIHQYWTLLAPHFRDVFLAPQRRSDDGGVSWTWRERKEKSPLTAAELAGVRSRLERCRESFEENPVNPLMNETRSGGANSQEIIAQLTARVKSVADSLAALPDAALSEFVCRTEIDVMVHSWGVASAAKIVYPDSLESGVGGVVLFGGKGSVGNDVVIDNAKGLRVARTTTDEAGEFVFTKLAPGRYRVRVISGPGEFSEKGVQVTVERGEMSRIELRSTSDPEAPAGDGGGEQPAAATTATNAPAASGRRRNMVWVVLVALLLPGGGAWLYVRNFRGNAPSARASQRISMLTPEKFSPTKPAARSEPAALAGAAQGQEAVGSKAQPVGIEGTSPALVSPAAAVSKIGTRVELSGAPQDNAPVAATGAGSGAQLDAIGNVAMSSSSAKIESKRRNPEGALPKNAGLGEGLSGPTGDATKDRAAQSPGTVKNDALTGHLPAAAGGLPPGLPAGSEEWKNTNLAKECGYAPEDGKAKEGTATAPAPGGGAKGGGAAAASSVPSEKQKGAVGAGGINASSQAPVAAVTVVEKPADKPRPDAADSAGHADPAQEGEKPKSSPDTAAVAGPSGAAEPKSEPQNSERETEGEQGYGTTAGAAAKGRPANPSSSSTPTASEKDPTEQAKPAVPSTVFSEPLLEKPLPAGMQAMGTLRTGGWRLRVGRDAIIPTQPVPEGEADTAEAMRHRMLDGAKAVLPATLQRPRLRAGLVFKFTSGVKAQPLRWVEERRGGVDCTLSEVRAEAGWAISAPPRNDRLMLVYANGSEAARVEFDRDGGARVFVRKEIRAVIWFGAKYADAENANDASVPRMGWQVLRGPLAASAWTNDSRWLDGTVCRLEMVMNGANPAGTRIALVDQTSGWLLATELE